MLPVLNPNLPLFLNKDKKGSSLAQQLSLPLYLFKEAVALRARERRPLGWGRVLQEKLTLSK